MPFIRPGSRITELQTTSKVCRERIYMSVPLILTSQTGLVAPQFHSTYDDAFWNNWDQCSFKITMAGKCKAEFPHWKLGWQCGLGGLTTHQWALFNTYTWLL